MDDYQTKFYLANLIVMLQYLHDRNIIYRDLKAENIICEKSGYLRLIDFGAAKALGSVVNIENPQEDEVMERTFTMVGTPHYMAPEVLQQTGHGRTADFWSLGVLLFEMVCGYVPYGEDETDVYKIYEMIQSESVEFPEDLDDQKLMNLILKLLNKSPESRVRGEVPELMADPYFDGFDWEALTCEEMKPPYVPEVDDLGSEAESTEQKRKSICQIINVRSRRKQQN